MAARRRRQRTSSAGRPAGRRVGLVGGLFRALAFALLVWTAGFILFVLNQAAPAADTTETDGIVVLTGGPGRVARGVALMEAGRARRLLVSGVDARVTPAEFRAAAGVAPELMRCCVDLGFAADSTRANADEAAAWIGARGFRSIRLVTAGYHMPRAEAELAARLPAEVVIVPDGVRAGLPLVAMLLEYAKFQASWVMLRVRPA